jgi:hypothetical protein
MRAKNGELSPEISDVGKQGEFSRQNGDNYRKMQDCPLI